MHALNRTTDPGPGSISTASDGFDSDFNIWTFTELHMVIVHMHEELSCFVFFFFTEVIGMSRKGDLRGKGHGSKLSKIKV